MNDQEIEACYHHQEPVDDRIVWWEEFQGIDTGSNDVREKHYPGEFYWK